MTTRICVAAAFVLLCAVSGVAPALSPRVDGPTFQSRTGDRDSTKMARELARRTPVTVVLAETPQGGTVIQRGVGPNRIDVIRLPRDAEATDLLHALLALSEARSRGGESSDRAVMLKVGTIPSANRRPQKTPELDRLSRSMQRLRQGAPREIDGLGRVRHVILYLPKARQS